MKWATCCHLIMFPFFTSHPFSFNQAIKLWRFVTFHIFIFTSTSLYFKCLNYVYQICLADLSFQHRPQSTKNVRCVAKTSCCLDCVIQDWTDAYRSLSNIEKHLFEVKWHLFGGWKGYHKSNYFRSPKYYSSALSLSRQL